MVATWYMRRILLRASGSLRAQTLSRSMVRKNWTSHFHHMARGFTRGKTDSARPEKYRQTITMVIVFGQGDLRPERC